MQCRNMVHFMISLIKRRQNYTDNKRDLVGKDIVLTKIVRTNILLCGATKVRLANLKAKGFGI